MASTALTAAKIVGLTGAAWLSGTIASISLISVPAVSKSLKEDSLSAAQAVKLWRNNYELGKALAPPIAVATASSLAFCGWTTRNICASKLRDGRLFFVASVAVVTIVPFTLLVMKPTNDVLLRFAKKEELTASESQDGEALLKRWVFLNGVRSLLPLAGAVITGVLVIV